MLITEGVRRIVGVGKEPVAVEEEELLAIRQTLDNQVPLLPHPFLRVGQRVRVKHGPLKGVEGILLTIEDSYHLVLSVTLLMRSVKVRVEPHWIDIL